MATDRGEIVADSPKLGLKKKKLEELQKFRSQKDHKEEDESAMIQSSEYLFLTVQYLQIRPLTAEHNSADTLVDLEVIGCRKRSRTQ